MAKSLGCRAERFGIMNHVGTIWTPDSFDREDEAKVYLDACREEWRRKGWGDLSKHRVVRVRVTVLPARTERRAKTAALSPKNTETKNDR